MNYITHQHCIHFHAEFNSWEMRPEEAEALSFLLPLSKEYPDIESWFKTKVVPGIRNGTRKILRVDRDGTLAGLGIAKLEPDERKICTVRVSSPYIGRGIGIRIFDGLLRWLDDDKPHLTVSAGKLPQFQRVFDWYGFNLTSSQAGLYVPHSTEYGFNELTYTMKNPVIIEQPNF